MYVVIVKFESIFEESNTFKNLLLQQASNSLQKEPECHQFDIVQDEQQENIFYLYEIYTNRKAFDVHLASEHFKTFDQTVAPIVVKKEVFLGLKQA
jgi:quinol monooxygenase YgiN